jgi:riboflavin biosynthesis pyrimidine reductase
MPLVVPSASMRQLLPSADDAPDPDELYGADARPAPAGRPWLLVNMIASVDGATAVDGRSGGLGGAGDHRIFAALRGVPDIILVAAGTVRAENYHPVTLPDHLQERRRARGQDPVPRLAIVTRSLDLDLRGPLFEAGTSTPIVITSPGSDRVRRSEVTAAGADLMLAGTGADLDLAVALSTLGEMGASVVLSEGGPSFNGALVAAGLVDEVCLSVAPALVGGPSARIAHGPDAVGVERLLLRRVLEDEGYLFLRYARA